MKAKILLIVCIGCIITMLSACLSDNEQMFNRYYTAGALLYRTNCQNCHGVNGEGLGALIPPFQDSVYLKHNLAKMPCFVKNGLTDTITVAGKTYSSKMPPQDNLSDIELAEILTYVTNSFGNKLGVVDAPMVNNSLSSCK